MIAEKNYEFYRKGTEKIKFYEESHEKILCVRGWGGGKDSELW